MKFSALLVNGMRQTPVVSFVLPALSFLATAGIAMSVFADDHGKAEAKPTLITTEITDTLFMIKGEGGFTGGNVVVAVGDKHLVMIDDKIPAMGEPLMKAVKAISDRPITFLVNTHLHKDHSGNNAAFAKQHTHIVGHDNVRVRMKNKADQYAVEDLPVLTYSQSMSIHIAGQPAVLTHTPSAHTDGDSIIHFTEAKVLHAGDLFFNGLFPYIDLDSGGSVDGYIRAQQTILNNIDDNTTIIPGHGPIADKKTLQKHNAMLIDAKRIVEAALSKGQSLEQMQADKVLSKYQSYHWGFITQDKMIAQLYRDLADK